MQTQEAAQAYRATLERLSAVLGATWTTIDWNEGSLLWRFQRPNDTPRAIQGWKIHVSMSAPEATLCLTILTDILAELRLPFKLPCRLRDLVFLNSGDAGVSALGKVLTLYPAEDAQLRFAIAALDRVWPISSGPEVQTDIHLRRESAVSIRYGVFRAGAETVDSTGIHEFALVAEDGTISADTRSLNGRQQLCAPAPPICGVPPTPLPIMVNVPFRLGVSEYIPLVCIGETPRAATFLAVETDCLQTVVVKAGRRGVAGSAICGDIRTTLRTEFAILRELESCAKVAPRALHLNDSEWPVLIMEDTRGTTVSELPRQQRFDCLALLAKTLVRIHEAGFVHGDVKLDNAIAVDGGVCLIDFELSARIGAPMSPAGTPGYLSPEVNGEICPADTARDGFALAVCVVQAVLDIPPALLPAGSGRLQAMLGNEGESEIARALAPWLANDPARRPTVAALASVLQKQVPQWRSSAPDRGKPSTVAELRWCRRAASDAAALVSAYKRPGAHGACWRNEHFMHAFECEAINIGAAGIMLGLRSVDCAFARTDHDADVDQGARWLANRPAVEKAAGLFSGNAGVALALAVAGQYLDERAYLTAARQRLAVASADLRELDLFSGAAGVIYAATVLHDLTQDDWPLDAVRGLLDHLDQNAAMANGVPVWTLGGDTSAATFGCAHGSAGVALALASWGRARGCAGTTERAREVFRCLAREGRSADGTCLLMGPGEVRHHSPGNWCHGTAGYLWALLNGLGDDPALRTEIDWAVTTLSASSSTGTSTYCHGLAGQLEIWHMLETVPRFQTFAHDRARKVARALRITHVKVGTRCAWLSDDREVITPDLWIGFLGPASALAKHSAGVGDALLSVSWLAACAGKAVRPTTLPHARADFDWR